MIRVNDDSGPGGREIYIDNGEFRVIVRQLASVNNRLAVPEIIAPSFSDSHTYIVKLIDALEYARKRAESWAVEVGMLWHYEGEGAYRITINGD